MKKTPSKVKRGVSGSSAEIEKSKMPPELATIAAATIAALMIVFQLGRQHRNESDRQENATRSKLKLEIYQQFAPYQ